jgi:hypothetical protein
MLQLVKLDRSYDPETIAGMTMAFDMVWRLIGIPIYF